MPQEPEFALMVEQRFTNLEGQVAMLSLSMIAAQRCLARVGVTSEQFTEEFESVRAEAMAGADG